MNQSGVDEIGDQWLDHYNDRLDMDMDPMEATGISVLLKRSSGNKGPIVRERILASSMHALKSRTWHRTDNNDPPTFSIDDFKALGNPILSPSPLWVSVTAFRSKLERLLEAAAIDDGSAAGLWVIMQVCRCRSCAGLQISSLLEEGVIRWLRDRLLF